LHEHFQRINESPDQISGFGVTSACCGVLLEKLHHQAMGFTSVSNKLAPIVEAFFVEAKHFFRWWRVERDAVGELVSH
jgi:hypothetical protein